MDGPRARLVETHSAVVVFTGDRAYKLKKPVSLGFLDFRLRSAREAACHREVELNRRLAPDVYLGVADVLDTSGQLCDHLVVMRRLPDDRRLATLVRAPHDVHAEIRAVAHAVAAFHARAVRSPEIDAAATPAAVLRLWSETIEQTRRFAGPVLVPDIFEHVATAAQRYVGGRHALFDARIAAGHVCDGHGDLLADDIFCMPDGPRILDCVEFEDRFRHGDGLADLAFLFMDLERLDRADLAGQLLHDYEEFSGHVQPRSLLHHYAAYRAMVRCKVACVRHEQGDPDAAAEARALLDIAFRHSERARVQMMIVGGLPGTGKSTLAAGLRDALGATLIRSDEVRLDVSGAGRNGDRATHPDPYRGGVHDSQTTAATYAEMLRRAHALLVNGESVVLDATWNDRRRRHAARRLAWQTLSDVCELRCDAPADVVAERIRRRMHRGDDVSRATPEIATRMASDADPWPSAQTIDTTMDPPATLARALHAVARAGTSGTTSPRPSPLSQTHRVRSTSAAAGTRP
jgi:aminoglycoside phosphotransferase family enzyme/predicted kinase